MVSDQRLIEAVSKYGRRCYKIRFRRYQTSIPVSTPHDLARLHATYWPEIWGDICDKYARKAGSWLFENEPHLQEATFRGFAARQFSPDFAATAWYEYTAG